MHIPWACATPKRVREASLTHARIPSSIPAQRSGLDLDQLAWLQVCDTCRWKKGTKPTRLGRSSCEAQSRNRPARRGAFFDVGSSVRWKRGLDVGTDVGTEYMDQAAAALHNMAQTPLNR